ncbi:carbonic anhydrase [Lichenifustis flavocetrariae]|uniref:carbonic anhydrase n=1 Tax=Lichenifustis flavocetrariae TaxID=2949735 RepID=A0AA42CN05_9HYPH|nr:carbonic anhydrase [Lichenifustis flavocetrariae]MCW6508900.1 carbonic anhydrase [Lichenifustis flavocetrariae]
MVTPATLSSPQMTPDQALALLKEGNKRFVEGNPIQSHMTGRELRTSLAHEQRPFCVLVGCSDSRVSPELLFGRGLGDLFIVRNAGNVVDLAAMGSIEYGVAVLGAPLVLVLGHERCGAVHAALNVVENDTVYPGSIGQMIEPIIPAVLRARREGGADLLDRSVRANVHRVVERLRTTEQMLLQPQRDGKLKIIGARYDLDDGHVDFFE